MIISSSRCLLVRASVRILMCLKRAKFGWLDDWCSWSAVVSIYEKWCKERTVVNQRQGHGLPRLTECWERRLALVAQYNTQATLACIVKMLMVVIMVIMAGCMCSTYLWNTWHQDVQRLVGVRSVMLWALLSMWMLL